MECWSPFGTTASWVLIRSTAGWSRMFEIFMKEMVYWDAYYDGSSELRENVLFTRVLP